LQQESGVQMIEVRVGARGYQLDANGQPIITEGKYPPGDCRRLGPQYVHFQSSSRSREEKRGRLIEHARKMGYSSFGAMLYAQRTTGGERAPKEPGRSAALKRDNPLCARKAQRNGKTRRRHNQELSRGLARRAGGADV
jgi:hypothetical protein